MGRRAAQGQKIPVVGGSDYHRDYVVTDLMINPVTYVYAESNSVEDILSAIRAGRTTIAAGVGKTMIEITCAGGMIGDTVKVKDDTDARVTVKGLKKGHTLRVFGTDGLMYKYKATSTGDYAVNVPVGSSKFMYAVVDYPVMLPVRVGQNLIMRSRNHCGVFDPVPDFIYAQTGAIYFEK